jgi:hypothetical protein
LWRSKSRRIDVLCSCTDLVQIVGGVGQRVFLGHVLIQSQGVAIVRRKNFKCQRTIVAISPQAVHNQHMIYHVPDLIG